MVPLAFLLDDERLKAKVRHWADQILTHQAADGWLGPVLDSRYSYPYDTWPRFMVLKALTQYHDATGDERIPQAVEHFLRKLPEVLEERPLRSWALYRWVDLVLSIHWLYARTGAAWLLDACHAALQRLKRCGVRVAQPFVDHVAHLHLELVLGGIHQALELPCRWRFNMLRAQPA
jgi:hypothetical protein